MSLYAPSDFGYLQQAEAYFLSHSKVGVMLSSKDIETLRKWREGGIPIEVVCHGIRRSFHEFEDPPRNLFRCRKFVEFELQAWKDRLVGQGREQTVLPLAFQLPGKDLPDPTDPARRKRLEGMRKQSSGGVSPSYLSTKEIPKGEHMLAVWYRSMWTLMERGKAAKTQHARDAYRWAYRRMNELRKEALIAREDREIMRRLALAVGQVEAEMYNEAYRNLSEDERALIEARMPANMERALGSMSDEARKTRRLIWLRRILEEVQDIKPFFSP